jgi:hypothetical protein
MVQGPLRAAGVNLTKKVTKTALQNRACFGKTLPLLPDSPDCRAFFTAYWPLLGERRITN